MRVRRLGAGYSLARPDFMAHSHSHGHTHSHGPASPHPAQPAPWSILRMTLPARLGAALAVSAALWAVVLLAMRPS
ncbi:hypothetical protein AB7828_17505 [Tardiphaga sp. 215_C5_N2_1]|uniref:hypothetical protein n=1 Tax=Tardiphaga sp. 215_C5_N2_1 TaxID=3240774 RepID=UPI003F8BBAD9